MRSGKLAPRQVLVIAAVLGLLAALASFSVAAGQPRRFVASARYATRLAAGLNNFQQRTRQAAVIEVLERDLRDAGELTDNSGVSVKSAGAYEGLLQLEVHAADPQTAASLLESFGASAVAASRQDAVSVLDTERERLQNELDQRSSEGDDAVALQLRASIAAKDAEIAAQPPVLELSPWVDNGVVSDESQTPLLWALLVGLSSAIVAVSVLLPADSRRRGP